MWSRAIGGEIRAQFDQQLADGEIATCAVVKLELLYSARNAAEYDALSEELETLPGCPLPADAWTRALAIYRELAHQGGLHQRSVKHADLLIAVAAELAGLTILHYDEDYDRLASVTGQPVEWLAPRGSLGR